MQQKIIYSSPPKCKTCGKIPTSWDINLTDYECNQCTAERVGDNILNSILKQFNMKEEYVIINKTTLQKRIEELEKELTYHSEWYEKATDAYSKNKKFWGQADDGEMRVASDAVSENQKEIKILKQILSKSIPLIPEIEKAFDAGVDKIDVLEPREKDKQEYISNLKLDI